MSFHKATAPTTVATTTIVVSKERRAVDLESTSTLGSALGGVSVSIIACVLEHWFPKIAKRKHRGGSALIEVRL